MTHEERLKEYVEKDKIYQEYKNNKPPSDFDRFCFVHCEDIEWALGEIKHLRELQKNMDQQYEELETNWKELKKYIEKIIVDSKAGSGQQYYYQQVYKFMQELESGKNEQRK